MSAARSGSTHPAQIVASESLRPSIASWPREWHAVCKCVEEVGIGLGFPDAGAGRRIFWQRRRLEARASVSSSLTPIVMLRRPR